MNGNDSKGADSDQDIVRRRREQQERERSGRASYKWGSDDKDEQRAPRRRRSQDYRIAREDLGYRRVPDMVGVARPHREESRRYEIPPYYELGEDDKDGRRAPLPLLPLVSIANPKTAEGIDYHMERVEERRDYEKDRPNQLRPRERELYGHDRDNNSRVLYHYEGTREHPYSYDRYEVPLPPSENRARISGKLGQYPYSDRREPRSHSTSATAARRRDLSGERSTQTEDIWLGVPDAAVKYLEFRKISPFLPDGWYPSAQSGEKSKLKIWEMKSNSLLWLHGKGKSYHSSSRT